VGALAPRYLRSNAQAWRGSAGVFTRPAKSCCGCGGSSAKLTRLALSPRRREERRTVFRGTAIGLSGFCLTQVIGHVPEVDVMPSRIKRTPSSMPLVIWLFSILIKSI
jgi:hypothetical protein